MTDHPIPPSPDRRYAEGFEAGTKAAAEVARSAQAEWRAIVHECPPGIEDKARWANDCAQCEDTANEIGDSIAALIPPAKAPQSAGETFSDIQIDKAIMTACSAHPVGAGDGGTYVMGTPTRESMRAAISGLRASQSALDQAREEGAKAADGGRPHQKVYDEGWDDCLEAIYRMLGERFPRRP